jgi:hypothetical protein
MRCRALTSLILLALGLPAAAVHAQYTTEAPAKPPENLTPEQQAHFREIAAEFARFDETLAGVSDVHFKGITLLILDQLKQRVHTLRSNWDQTRYDEIRFELNAEYQRLTRWLTGAILSVPTVDASGAPLNTLSEAERSAGWQLLFDGQSLAGWRGYRMKSAPAGWEVREGVLRTSPATTGAVDLVTERKFTNFELAWEWRVAPGASSGIKYFVSEERPTAAGHEYQILDDEGDPDRAWHGDAHRTGAFYDVVPPGAAKSLRPTGAWNHSRLVVSGRRVEHWLNGANILTYEIGSSAVKQGIARSSFKDVPGFGEKVTGPVLIAHHPSETWYRNIKVRELK